jgi:hypothetical protein
MFLKMVKFEFVHLGLTSECEQIALHRKRSRGNTRAESKFVEMENE